MVFLSKRRRKGFTAFAMVLWLFAIFVSVAHACGLQVSFRQSNLSEDVVRAGAASSSHGETSPNCDKLCADALPLPTKLSAVQDPSMGDVVLTVSVARESFHASAASILLPSPSLGPPLGIAVNTRFVRLALWPSRAQASSRSRQIRARLEAARCVSPFNWQRSSHD
jgi:hypothetical protein